MMAPDSGTPPQTGVLWEERPAWLTPILGAARGNGVRVGVVDSGWDALDRPTQVQRGVGLCRRGSAFVVDCSADDRDRIGHGTACGTLIASIADRATLIPIRVFDKRLETSVAVLVAAIEWAARQRLDVLNLSLGTDRTDAIPPLYKACAHARAAGVLIVAAQPTGDRTSYPAAFDNVISVGPGDFANGYDFVYQSETHPECLAKQDSGHHARVYGHQLGSGAASYAAPRISGLLAVWCEARPSGRGLSDARNFLLRASFLKRSSEGG